MPVHARFRLQFNFKIYRRWLKVNGCSARFRFRFCACRGVDGSRECRGRHHSRSHLRPNSGRRKWICCFCDASRCNWAQHSGWKRRGHAKLGEDLQQRFQAAAELSYHGRGRARRVFYRIQHITKKELNLNEAVRGF